MRFRFSKKKVLILSSLFIMCSSMFAYAWHWYIYSDGSYSAHWTRRFYLDHLHFGLEHPEYYPNGATLIADGDWYGDPTVAPDYAQPSKPGLRERTKDRLDVLKEIHKDFSEIDRTSKVIKDTTDKTEDVVLKIYNQGEKRLVGINFSDEKIKGAINAVTKDTADLSKYSTWVNPENRKESEKLTTPISVAERKELLKKMPLLDVKEASGNMDPDQVKEAFLKDKEFFRKVASEATEARLLVLKEIEDVQKAVADVIDSNDKMTMSNSQKNELLKTFYMSNMNQDQIQALLESLNKTNMSNSQKLALLEALNYKMKVLSLKLNYINETENEVKKKYETKRKLEQSARDTAMISYPAYDPYHPTEEDKKKVHSSSKNFGFISFKQ